MTERTKSWFQDQFEKRFPKLAERFTSSKTGTTIKLSGLLADQEQPEISAGPVVSRMLVEYQWSGEWGSPNLTMVPEQTFPAGCQVVKALSYDLVLWGQWDEHGIHKYDRIGDREGPSTVIDQVACMVQMQRVRTAIAEDGRIFHDIELLQRQPELLLGLLAGLRENFGTISAAQMFDALIENSK